MDSRSESAGPGRVFFVLAEGCRVGYSRGFAGAVCCTCGRSNTTNDLITLATPVGRATTYSGADKCKTLSNYDTAIRLGTNTL